MTDGSFLKMMTFCLDNKWELSDSGDCILVYRTYYYNTYFDDKREIFVVHFCFIGWLFYI